MGKRIWQTINKLNGRKQNHNNKVLELKINTELVTDPIIISTELNTFFLASVYEITQLFNSPSYSICSINYAQPNFCLFALRQSIVPSAWKMALVTSIFKSGEKSDMANYRPISILPVVSKIVEK